MSKRYDRIHFICPRHPEGRVLVDVQIEVCERHMDPQDYHDVHKQWRGCTGAVRCGFGRIQYGSFLLNENMEACHAHRKLEAETALLPSSIDA